ncbi:MAG: serine--tRNA ligase [Elusimicrobia bacterium]|nr:serine--tRNA ligase [Elusimicrobiota bacterium]
MIDLKKVREQPDLFRQAYKNRGGRYLPALEELLEKDGRCRKLLLDVETLRSKKNELSKKVGALRASGKDDPSLMKESEDIKRPLMDKEKELAGLQTQMEALALGLPNAPDASTPLGASPEDNKVVRNWGEPKKLDFKALDHQAIGEKLGIFDFERAAKLAGSRFALLKGKGAALERALISFMLNIHTKEHGYQEFWPPYFASAETLTASGHLPKFKEELYQIHKEEPGPDLYLIPTSEVSLVNLHRGEMLDEKNLPLAYTAYTACFRSEAGSYGKDIRGLIRNHQFNKVELVRFAFPEKSMEDLELMTKQACVVLERLGIPHRVLALCSADLGFASTKTYDLEVWMPGENKWREISSCSNCLDFQARRANIKIKRADGKKEFVHTLNGSGVAVGRCLAAILENYQTPEGRVSIPDALRPYTGFDSI